MYGSHLSIAGGMHNSLVEAKGHGTAWRRFRFSRRIIHVHNGLFLAEMENGARHSDPEITGFE